jgi:hypothetical protein
VISATSQRSGGPTGADEAPLSGNPSPETLRGTQGATEEKDIAVVLRAQKKRIHRRFAVSFRVYFLNLNL